MTPWLKATIGGERWGYYLVAPKSRHLIAEDGKRLTGRCDYNKCRIYLSRDLYNDAFLNAFFHETVHAFLFVTGADQIYQGDVHKDELLVCALAPALLRFLLDIGAALPTRTT